MRCIHNEAGQQPLTAFKILVKSNIFPIEKKQRLRLKSDRNTVTKSQSTSHQHPKN